MGRLLAFAAAYGGYVVFLHAVDGPWKRWEKGAVRDKWSLTHVAWGGIAQTFGLSRAEVLALAAANEVGEYAVRKTRPDLLWGSPETPANVALDIAATSAGYELVRALRG